MVFAFSPEQAFLNVSARVEKFYTHVEETRWLAWKTFNHSSPEELTEPLMLSRWTNMQMRKCFNRSDLNLTLFPQHGYGVDWI
jgi:hypothetical protein